MIREQHTFAVRQLNVLDEHGNEGCAHCGRPRHAHIVWPPPAPAPEDTGIRLFPTVEDVQRTHLANAQAHAAAASRLANRGYRIMKWTLIILVGALLALGTGLCAFLSLI